MHGLDTPCIGVCSTLFDAKCKGCGRTQFEVDNWVFLSVEEKALVWQRISADGTAVVLNRFQPKEPT